MCFQIYLADLIGAIDEVFNIDPSEVLCSALFFGFKVLYSAAFTLCYFAQRFFGISCVVYTEHKRRCLSHKV